MILHVYTLCTLRFDGIGGDTVCDLVIDEDIRGGLGIAEIGEGLAQPGGHLSGMKCRRIFYFADRGHYVLNY